MIQQITLEEYLMGRDKQFPISDAMHLDALVMVSRANQLLAKFGEYRKVSSGYRPAAINVTTKGAAKHSNHMICRAVDLQDHDGKLDEFCMNNLALLSELELWLETPHTTLGWCHISSFPPISHNRVFIP